jgi:uncharacterized protein YecE (DUF72 family)
MSLYLGCPVWAYKGWVGPFYPSGTESSDYLKEYARRLTTVEGNTTFYATPSPDTLQRWAEEMPETFRFCPKLPRAISHTGTLGDKVEQVMTFREAMQGLGPRLGPMFLQLPPRYSPAYMEDLGVFLESWPAQPRLAVEVRHPGWFDSPPDQGLNQLLSGLDMARVIIDTRPIRDLSGDRILQGSVYQRMLEARQRKPDSPVAPRRTTDFTFLRYIGHPQMAVNEPFIEAWAGFLEERLAEGDSAYIFCHCPDERLDPWLCRRFHEAISERLEIPPLPWDKVAGDAPRQPRLF